MNDYFSYENYFELHPMYFCLAGVTLLRDLGEIKEGSKFKYVYIDISGGQKPAVRLCPFEGREYEFGLEILFINT